MTQNPIILGPPMPRSQILHIYTRVPHLAVFLSRETGTQEAEKFNSLVFQVSISEAGKFPYDFSMSMARLPQSGRHTFLDQISHMNFNRKEKEPFANQCLP